MKAYKIENIVKTLLVLLLLAYAGAGFHGYEDIEKRFFVVSMGIDEGKNGYKYEVILKLALPQADPKAAKNEYLILKKDSDAIGTAVASLKTQVDKELDFGHMKMIFIGESLAKKELKPTLDWFFRRRDIQKIAFVAVARPDAATVQDIKPSFEKIPSNSYFLAFGDEGTESPYIITEYIFDLHRRLHERGIDPVVPIVESTEKRFDISRAYVVTMKGAALELGPQETGMFSMLLHRAERATLSVIQEENVFTVNADEIQLKYKLQTSGKPRVIVTGKVLSTLESSSESVEPKELGKYERAVEKQINEEVLAMLKKFQAASVDPLGIGLRYRATHFNNATEWDEWLNMYPQLEFESDIRVILETTGVVE
ncbi:hypothetical protein FE782_09940 [Paenibacillus antri]|uniref:Ger(X)C family spore germination protein n=1 Tax=Paenibacillus antri TaxID=2582848 RepID=A0A5R9G7A2_9BACL|nr:Ger(x)C family spore germination C-terminal domain-containing protein [Paenibacillus antri]TLS52287.1 hypothetical protein FE782_09940 [Paenibacillus antri]